MRLIFIALSLVFSVCHAQTLVKPLQGGTGVANANTKTITLGGPFSTSAGITISGPAAPRTYTLPDANATLLYSSAANLQTFLTTPSSANLAALITDETGSGASVFGTSPAITTSLTTASTTFSLINANATIVNFAAGASTSLNIGNALGSANLLGTWNFGGNITITGLITAPNISPSANFALTQNSVDVITSESSGALVDTLHLKTGFVGIGASAPASRLQISNTTGAAAMPTSLAGTAIHVGGADGTNVRILVDGFASGASFSGRRAAGTIASKTAVAVDNPILNITGTGYGVTGYVTAPKVSIAFTAAETWTDSANGTYMTFSTTAIGGSTNTVQMKIADTGNVTFSAQIISKGYTVAGLPTGIEGGRAHVTDQLTTCAAIGAAILGGGAVKCPVFYNGTAWVGG